MSARKKSKPKPRIEVAERWHYERVDGDPTLRQIADVLAALGMKATVTLHPIKPRVSWWKRLLRRPGARKV